MDAPPPPHHTSLPFGTTAIVFLHNHNIKSLSLQVAGKEKVKKEIPENISQVQTNYSIILYEIQSINNINNMIMNLWHSH